MKLNIKKLIIYSSILIFAAVLNLAYFYALPAMINIEKYKPKVKEYLKESFSVPIELGKLDIDMTWNLGVKIKFDNAVLKKNDGAKFINLGDSYIELSLIPLVNKHIEVRQVVISNPDVNITRFKDGTVDITKILVKKKKSEYTVDLKDTSVILNNYKINFSDNYISPSKTFVMRGENLNIIRFTPDKFIEVQAKGVISEDKKCNMPFDLFLSADLPIKKQNATTNKLKIKGNIANFDLEEIHPYINKYYQYLSKIKSNKIKQNSVLKKSVFQGTGSVSFDIDLNKEIPGRRKFFIQSKTNNLKIVDAIKGDILSHNGNLDFFTGGSFDDNDLYLDNFQVNGNKIHTDIKGKISNFARKKIRNVDLRLDINDTSAKKAAEIFPKNIKVKLDPFNKILKHNIDGNASGNLQIKGYYRTPDIFGKIKYDNLSVIEKNEETKNSSGTVEFLGPTLIINSIQYLGKNQFVKTSGSVVPFKGKRVKLSINTTQKIDFTKCLPVLFAVRDIFQFKLYPVTDMDIKGLGKVNLDIEGANQNALLNGYVEAQNVTLKFKTLAGQAEKVNGKIIFKADKVYYDEISGYVDGIKVIPSGYTTLHSYSDIKLYMPNLDLKKGQKFVYGSSLLVKAQVALKEILDIKGVADTQIFLKGKEENLDSRGILKFNDAYVNYNGYGEPFNNLKGQLRYINENVYFDNVNGNVSGNNVTLNGSASGLSKDIDLKIDSKNIKLEDAKKFVEKSSLLYKTHKIVKDFALVNGTAAINLKLKGNANKNPLNSLIFSNINAIVNYKKVGIPVKISQGSINITEDILQTNGLQTSVGNTNFTLQGKLSNLKANFEKNAPIIPDIEIKTGKLDSSTINELTQISEIPYNVRNLLAGASRSEGFAAVLLRIRPSSFNAKLNFNNFALIYKKKDLPFVIESGQAEILDKNIYLSAINGKILNSDFFVSGSVKNYMKKPEFKIISSVKINSDDSERLSSLFKHSLEMKGVIPLSANIRGNIDNWDIKGKMVLDKGVNLGYAKQIGLSDDKTRILILDAKGKQDKIDLKSLKILSFEKDDDLTYKSPWVFDIEGEKESLLHFSGSIDKLKTFKPVFKNFRIYTNDEKPLNLAVFNAGVSQFINNGNENFLSEGKFLADLTMNGYVFNPNILGYISILELKIPDYKLNLNNAKIVFSKDNIGLNFKDLKIDDSSVEVSAFVDYPIESPLRVKNIKISSNYLNIDKIAKVFVSNKTIIKGDTENFKLPLFVLQEGKLETKELILRDLITSDVKADVSFTPDGLLSVSDIQMNVAGGNGNGNIYYNTKSTELSMNLTAKNMQANALATTILRFPNEVYGSLNGEGQFYTKGRNSEEMISNSNGYADFKIYDGRLVRLGSLEYFLRAANVLQCGIGGFNINNVIDLVVPQKTGYFDKLEGKIDIKDGVITTEEITSSGQNLSLFISGNFDMLTNYADAKILGKLSKKVSGLLGPVGSISVNQFIGYVPGLGFMPTSSGEKGLIELIPGLSQIPVLGLDFNKKNRQFVVDINGNLYEQSSVKSFRWLD